MNLISNQHYDQIVVGGGIIGLMTARELRLRGYSVVVYDQGLVGQESSSAGGGIITPLYPWREPEGIYALANYGQKVYPALCDELKKETGIDPECIHSGYLVLDSNEYDEATQFAKEHQQAFDTIRGDQIQQKFPGLQIEHDVICFTGVHQVRPPCLIAALKQWLLHHGVEIRENSPVSRLIIEQDRVRGVVSGELQCYANQVIVSAGAWTQRLLAPYNHSLMIEPVKGQMITYLLGRPNFKPIIIKAGRYLIPRRDGEVVVGSTVEFVGFDKSITEQALQELKNAAEQIMPELKNHPIQKQWSGLRPGISSGVPIISLSNQIEQLYISTGHYRNGILMAPASARLMAEIIDQEPSSFHTSLQLYLLK